MVPYPLRLALITLICPLVLTSDSFLIEEGELGVEVVGDSAYLYNRRGNSVFYYQKVNGVYKPDAGTRSENTLHFYLKDSIPADATPLGFEKGKQNGLLSLNFVEGNQRWEVLLGQNGYMLALAVSSSMPPPPTVPSAVEKQEAVAPFQKPLDSLVPNFTLDLEDVHIGTGGDEVLRQEMIQYLESQLDGVNLEDGFLKNNKLDGSQDPAQVFGELYRALVTFNRNKRDQTFPAAVESILGRLSRLREQQSQLALKKSDLISAIDSVQRTKNHLALLAETQREKYLALNAAKQRYISDMSIHSESGLYVVRFAPVTGKSLARHLDEIDRLLISRATAELGRRFIAGFDETERAYFKDEYIGSGKGVAAVIPGANDLIPVGESEESEYLLIRDLVFLPNAAKPSDLPAPDPEQAESYALAAILDNDGLKSFMKKNAKGINRKDKKEIGEKLEVRLDSLLSRQTLLAKTRASLFGAFLDQVRANGLDQIELTKQIDTLKDELRRGQEEITISFEAARELYEGNTGFLNNFTAMEAETENLRAKLDDRLLSFGIAELGVTQPASEASGRFTMLVYETLLALERRCQLEKEAIASLVAAGVLETESGGTPIFKHEYDHLSVYHEGVARQVGEQTTPVDYVVLSAHVSLSSEPLIACSFESMAVETEQLWEEIDQLNERKTLRLIEEPKPDPAETVPQATPAPEVTPKVAQEKSGSRDEAPETPTEEIKEVSDGEDEETTEEEIVEQEKPCVDCYRNGSVRYNLRYLDDNGLEGDDAVYERIMRSSPREIAASFGWRLPNETELEAMLTFFADNDTVAERLRNKIIFLDGENVSGGQYAAIHVKADLNYERTLVHSGDLAYFVFLVD